MYQEPLPPDPEHMCMDCTHYNYDSFHDEVWCVIQQTEVDGCGTCDSFELFKYEPPLDYSI